MPVLLFQLVPVDVKVSFIVARTAPMGWSVGSAVTAAMLMGATQRVVTAAAILAGQVSS